MLDQTLNTDVALTYATPLVAPTSTHQQTSVEIVRAESELTAIDDLMAELTEEFVADAKRRSS
ncbi:MAG: hypothetical protein H8E66_20750 [Planctomycetes bacterium]|nr:hypothetical protein [Planctomycetota bacterium]